MHVRNGINSSIQNITSNATNPQNNDFHDFNFFAFFYMLITMLVSNLSTSTIRGYRRSLPYLRINLILLLNCLLVEIFNTFVTFGVMIITNNIFPKLHLLMIKNVKHSLCGYPSTLELAGTFRRRQTQDSFPYFFYLDLFIKKEATQFYC